MANPYIHNSTLTETQVQEILRCYAGFVSPKDTAAQTGVSRQTTSSLYLKFSHRLHELRNWTRSTQEQDNPNIDTWLDRAEIAEAYEHYLNGASIEEYRTTRAGKMLAPDQYGPYLVGQELKSSWGKISEKAFLFHYALIKRTAEYRIDWMFLFGTNDICSPNVAKSSANQVYNNLEKSLRARPSGRK